MKFNWGHGVTIGFVAFAVYILSFVYRSFNENIDLVAEDYYAQEIAYQDRIDEQRNAEGFENDIEIKKSAEGVEIRFSTALVREFEKGQVHFYRPDDKEKDLKLPILLDSENILLVPAQLFSSGRYKVDIHWKGKKAYFLSKQVVI